MDLRPKSKRAFWETPRNIAILLTAVAGIVAGMAGFLGYEIGRQPPPAIYVHFDTPLTLAAPKD